MDWNGWKCREPESCFECPFPDCMKDLHGSGKNTGSNIIATFLDDTVEYFPKKEVGKLAERLNTTKETVLEAVNGDGWYKGVFMVWGRTLAESQAIYSRRDRPKRKAGDCDEVMVYWGDGQSRKFPSVREAADYLEISPETAYYRLRKGAPVCGVILQRLWQLPPDKEKFCRRKRGKGDMHELIPVPDDMAGNAMRYSVLFDDGSIEEYYTLRSLYETVESFVGCVFDEFVEMCKHRDKLKGIRNITLKGKLFIPVPGTVACSWPSGEVLRFASAHAAEKTLHVKAVTVKKYMGLKKPYRGVIFEDGSKVI